MKSFVKLTAALNNLDMWVDPTHVERVLGKSKDSGRGVGAAIGFVSGEIIGVHETVDECFRILTDQSEGPCEHVSEFIWGDGHNGHWACKKCGARLPSSLPQPPGESR